MLTLQLFEVLKQVTMVSHQYMWDALGAMWGWPFAVMVPWFQAQELGVKLVLLAIYLVFGFYGAIKFEEATDNWLLTLFNRAVVTIIWLPLTLLFTFVGVTITVVTVYYGLAISVWMIAGIFLLFIALFEVIIRIIAGR